MRRAARCALLYQPCFCFHHVSLDDLRCLCLTRPVIPTTFFFRAFCVVCFTDSFTKAICQPYLAFFSRKSCLRVRVAEVACFDSDTHAVLINIKSIPTICYRWSLWWENVSVQTYQRYGDLLAFFRKMSFLLF